MGAIGNFLWFILGGVFMGLGWWLAGLLAFVSIVGGLAVFGSSGLILGPVIFAITRLLLEIWNRRHAPQ